VGEECRLWSSLLWSFLYSPVTSSLLGQNIPLNTLFSNTLRLRSSLNISDQVSHSYKTADKIIVLYILIFKYALPDWNKFRQCWNAVSVSRYSSNLHVYLFLLKYLGFYSSLSVPYTLS
jgi:hypothetical protein